MRRLCPHSCGSCGGAVASATRAAKLEADDLELEMVHDFKYAGFVLNQIRRSNVAIDKPVFETL